MTDCSDDERRRSAVECTQAIAGRVTSKVEYDIDTSRANHGVECLVIKMCDFDPLRDALLEHARHRVIWLRRRRRKHDELHVRRNMPRRRIKEERDGMRAQVGRENADAQRAVWVAIKVLHRFLRREAASVIAQCGCECFGRRRLVVQQKQPARMHTRIEWMAKLDLIKQRERSVVTIHDIERIDAIEINIEPIRLKFRTEFACCERTRSIASCGERTTEADERWNKI